MNKIPVTPVAVVDDIREVREQMRKLCRAFDELVCGDTNLWQA
jgi:hypothetical protein